MEDRDHECPCPSIGCADYLRRQGYDVPAGTDCCICWSQGPADERSQVTEEPMPPELEAIIEKNLHEVQILGNYTKTWKDDDGAWWSQKYRDHQAIEEPTCWSDPSK